MHEKAPQGLPHVAGVQKEASRERHVDSVACVSAKVDNANKEKTHIFPWENPVQILCVA